MLTEHQQWVAFYTSSRAEKSVAAHIEEMGIESYLPLQRKLHKWSDRNKWVEEPLFKSYVFARINKWQLVPVRQTSGVVMPISFGNDIAIVPDSEINAIKTLINDNNELFVHNMSILRKGVRVKILAGPCKDMEGVLISNCDDGNFAVAITGIQVVLTTTVSEELLVPIDS